MTSIVQRLRFTHEHGLFTAANSSMDASYNESANIIDEMFQLALQYRDDLRRPPVGDSLERRLEAVEAVIAKVAQA